MSNMMPLSPAPLLECLNALSNVENILLSPTEALFWLIGHHEHITVDRSCSLVKQFHLENQKACLRVGSHDNPLVFMGRDWMEPGGAYSILRVNIKISFRRVLYASKSIFAAAGADL